MEPSLTAEDAMRGSPAEVVPLNDEALGMLFPRRGAVRRLNFDEDSGGGVHGPQMASTIDTHLAAIREEQKSRWNFDFEQMRPLPGRFLWEPVPLTQEGSRTEFFYDDLVGSRRSVRSHGAEAEILRRQQLRRQQQRHASSSPSPASADESVIARDGQSCCPAASLSTSDERLSAGVGEEGGPARALISRGDASSGSPRTSRQSVITEHMRPIRRTASNDDAPKPPGSPALLEEGQSPKRTRKN